MVVWLQRCFINKNRNGCMLLLFLEYKRHVCYICIQVNCQKANTGETGTVNERIYPKRTEYEAMLWASPGSVYSIPIRLLLGGASNWECFPISLTWFPRGPTWLPLGAHVISTGAHVIATGGPRDFHGGPTWFPPPGITCTKAFSWFISGFSSMF